MAKKKTPENKAAEAAEEQKKATTEAGEEQVKAAEEGPKLKKAQEKRQTELAQSGYRIPDSWAADEEDRKKHDEAVAKAMPSTRPDQD